MTINVGKSVFVFEAAKHWNDVEFIIAPLPMIGFWKNRRKPWAKDQTGTDKWSLSLIWICFEVSITRK